MPDAPSRLDRAAVALATLGPIGRMKKAPGTWGSAAALAAAPWCLLPLPPAGRAGLLAGLFLLGVWAAGRAERALGRKDPGCVVVDELVGQWTAFAPFAAAGWNARTPWELLALFALFRFFDILKPWPIRVADRRVKGGLGVMLDDVLAGLCAAASLGVVRIWI